MKLRSFLSIFMTFFVLALYSQKALMPPTAYFSDYGRHYHFHHQILAYIQYIDAQSEAVKVVDYGLTAQGRKLQLVIISAPENIGALDDIRQSHLYLSGLQAEAPKKINEKAIVWCSFGVHGNEAGTTESAINVIYELASGKDAATKDWLKNTVVIIDPSLNPDGFDRYVHFVKNVTGKQAHPSLTDREHMEPWPGGRYNHYLFDLNRDWAWQTQQETKSRIEVYNQWMPHIHADFHEMGYNDHYYFAPAATPFHQYITPFQKEFQTLIGKNHATHFDKNAWLYWTREVFDLFYPSYGDTYPSYSGAIGMTYEQAGHSASGRSILTNNGDTLTVQDKIDHNTVVALSTIEVASKNKDQLLKNFYLYFGDSKSNNKLKYKSYVLKKSPALTRLATLLDRNNILYGYATQKSSANGYHYQSRASQNFQVEVGDMVIKTNQARSVLLEVLMEEQSLLSDSMTYDITAWSLPFAYQLHCYGLKNELNIATTQIWPKETESNMDSKPVIAYQIPWNDLNSAKVLAELHKLGVRIKMTVKEAKYQGNSIPKGSLIIHRGDNRHQANFDQAIRSVLSRHQVYNCTYHYSGFSDEGGDLGGNYFQLIDAPKVLTFSGKGVSATSCGEIWHYFDQILDYGVSIVDWDQFESVDLKEYNTVVLPDGYYTVNESRFKSLVEWTGQGGRLIVIENAIQNFKQKEGLSFDIFASDEDKKASEETMQQQILQNRKNMYDGAERRYISKGTAGIIIKNNVDSSHPLAYGLGSSYYSLKTSSAFYALQKNKWNVVSIPKKYEYYGFIGHELKNKLEETVSFAVQNIGSGQAIFMVDNPLFRSFWDRGLLLFSNAIFLNAPTASNE